MATHSVKSDPTVATNMWDISNEEFTAIVAGSESYTDALRKCGYTNFGNAKTIKKRIAKLELSTEHFNKVRTPPTQKKPLDEILVENSTYCSNHALKKRLISELKWVYECSECKLTEWNNKPIALELDHINGANADHRIKNLRLLCPNCHSQTPTFRGKNKPKTKKRKCADCNEDIGKKNVSGYCIHCVSKYRGSKNPNKPNLQTLENDLKELETYVAVGAKYGVSDNCIRKWIRKYNQENTIPTKDVAKGDTEYDKYYDDYEDEYLKEVKYMVNELRIK